MKFSHTIFSTSLFLIVIFIFSCVSVEKVKTGDQAMERKQYAFASLLLKKEIVKTTGKKRAEKAFQIAESYRLRNQLSDALKWFLKSADYGKKDDLLFYRIGMMFKQTGNYQKAIDYFEFLSDNKSQLGFDASREKDICREVINWIDSRQSKYIIQALNPDNKGSEFISSIYKNGKLVITSDYKSIPNKMKFKWTGRNFSDIYLLDKENLNDYKAFPPSINSEYNEGSASFNSDYSEIYFTRCAKNNIDESFCHLYFSRQLDGEWQQAQKLNFIKPGTNYGHPYLRGDSILFFSSNDREGFGGYDIYFSKRNKTGWENPILLPSSINTPGNEKFPTIFNDTLYFSSDYLPGMGGLDIFKIYVMPNGRWSPPQNLMPPINSSYDDFNLVFDISSDKTNASYFNSSRINRDGLDRIYSISLKERDIAESTDSLIAAKIIKNYKLFLSLKIVEKVYQNENDPNGRVIGKKPIDRVKGIFEKEDIQFYSKKDGRYIREIEFDKSYTIVLQKDNYLSTTIRIPASRKPADQDASEIQTISFVAELIKPVYGTEIVLHDIYYDLDKWDIREDARPALNQLGQLLLDNPEINVLIGSHTDCRADESYNKALSNKRAISVVDYLKAYGIEESRLKYRGYGKTQLIEHCICNECTEKQHQKNRRTTFTLRKADP